MPTTVSEVMDSDLISDPHLRGIVDFDVTGVDNNPLGNLNSFSGYYIGGGDINRCT